jgi:hypothetical protein
MPKSDHHTLLQRIQLIANLLLKGHCRESILQYCSENWFISDRQADTYIQRAREIIEESVKRHVEFDYAKAIRRYEELYKLSLERKDFKTALSVNKELTALQGLLKLQTEHSGSVEFICNIPE